MDAIDFESMLKQARSEAFGKRQSSEVAPSPSEPAVATSSTTAQAPSLQLAPRPPIGSLEPFLYKPELLQGVFHAYLPAQMLTCTCIPDVYLVPDFLSSTEADELWECIHW